MKKTSIIILLALMSGAIFSGCKKEGGMNSITMSANQKAATGPISKETAANAISTISYQLRALPSSAQSEFQFLKAQATVGELLFNSESITKARPVAPPSNQLNPIETAESPQGTNPLNFSKQVNVNAALLSTTNLGTLDIRTSSYFNTSISVKLVPITGLSMVLGGTWNRGNNSPVSIDISISNDVLLASRLSSTLPVTARQYNALLTFNMDNVMGGIDKSLLANADIVNNVLSISSTSNQPLYQAVLTNLKNMPVVVEFVETPGNMVGIPVANSK